MNWQWRTVCRMALAATTLARAGAALQLTLLFTFLVNYL